MIRYGLLPLLLESTAVFDSTREFKWLSAPPGWVVFLVIVPLVWLAVRFVYRGENVAGRPYLRRVLVVLRVAAILAVIAMLAEPVLRTTRFLERHSTVLVLVDDSLSMDIADKYSDRVLVQALSDFFGSTPEAIESTTRYDLVRRLFRDPELAALEALREKGNVEVLSFADGLRKLASFAKSAGEAPLAGDERDVLPPYEALRTGERSRLTRVADALVDGVNSVRGGGLVDSRQPVSAVVLFSDGQQTAGSRAPAEVAARLGRQRIPVYTVPIGNPDEPKDIRVVQIDANDVVLANDRVPFDAIVISEGFEGERVQVDLKFDGAVVDTRFVVLEGKGNRQSVRLEYSPPKPGEFQATIEVEQRSGELFTENNTVSKPIRVLEEKIRVLYAEGPPRWEYRFLKSALTRDTTMATQVFLFSADKGFPQESSPGVPPLARFPRTREELFHYHVIFLGDVDFEREIAADNLRQEHVELLREFVYEAGGGLVFVSGFNSNPQRYLHTDLYPLLPVELDEGSALGTARGADPVSDSFNVELTPVGREHPVMRLENDYESNVRLWENPDQQFYERLPAFYWFAEVGREKPGTVVLARHPREVHPLHQSARVIFAFMNYGKGRTFFSGVDNTWRWRRGVENRYFYRFWGQVTRFCASGRLLGSTPRFSISTDKARYALGETINVDCRVFDANMQPSTEKSVIVYRQTRVSGGGEEVETIELQLDPVRGKGTYHGSMVADRVGLHDLWLGSQSERVAFRSYEVEVPALELRDPRCNKEVLVEIATASGGQSFDLHRFAELVQSLEGATQSQEGDIRDDPLWDDSWLLFALTGLLASEWILRKRARLL